MLATGESGHSLLARGRIKDANSAADTYRTISRAAATAAVLRNLAVPPLNGSGKSSRVALTTTHKQRLQVRRRNASSGQIPAWTRVRSVRPLRFCLALSTQNSRSLLSLSFADIAQFVQAKLDPLPKEGCATLYPQQRPSFHSRKDRCSKLGSISFRVREKRSLSA